MVEEGLRGETVTGGKERRDLESPGSLARALLDGGVKLGSGRKRREFSSVLDGLSRSTYGAVCREEGPRDPETCPVGVTKGVGSVWREKDFCGGRNRSQVCCGLGSQWEVRSWSCPLKEWAFLKKRGCYGGEPQWQ